MSGACNGVQAFLKEFTPQARNIRCCAHCLNKLLVQFITDRPSVRDFSQLVRPSMYSCQEAGHVTNYLSRSEKSMVKNH